MILEMAILDVKPDETAEFEKAFATAEPIIMAMAGYGGHEIRRCVERDGRYVLLVQWERLEDHTEGFRQSAAYQEWKRLLHRFYDPFPVVEHFTEWRRGAPSLRNKP